MKDGFTKPSMFNDILSFLEHGLQGGFIDIMSLDVLLSVAELQLTETPEELQVIGLLYAALGKMMLMRWLGSKGI